MKFVSFYLINLLWVVFFLGIFLFYRRSVKQKVLRRFISSELIPDIAGNFISRNEILKIIFLLLSLVFFVIALMRPQYGFELRETKREGLDIFIAIDVSKSMLTEDVKPNRLERSKLAVKDLIKKLKGDRIGLIAFSGESFLVCPLTVDYHGFALTLNDIGPKTISVGGTSLSSAMNAALRNYKDIAGKYKALVIISDGEDHEGDIEKVASKMKEKDIKVFTIGIGTSDGELIRVRNRAGEFEFVKDKNGNFIKSRMQESTLQQIAAMTGGIYVRASGAKFGLDLIYEEKLSKMDKTSSEAIMQKRYYERYQIPLAIAIFFICLEMLIPIRRNK